ncbi:hypothetical protein CY91_01150 [Dehalococcoides mccartyi]|nr:hypothetical protein CY91_01150 [Dehalococcoides mccartyi]
MALYLFFPRIEFILGIPDINICVYWDRFIDDFSAHPLTYILSVFIFIGWILLKCNYYKEKAKEQKHFNSSLNNIADKLGKIDKKIDGLSMRNDISSKSNDI